MRRRKNLMRSEAWNQDYKVSVSWCFCFENHWVLERGTEQLNSEKKKLQRENDKFKKENDFLSEKLDMAFDENDQLKKENSGKFDIAKVLNRLKESKADGQLNVKKET